MKILLLQSYLGRQEDVVVYPLGLANIATAISNRGHDVQMFDPNVLAHPYEDLQEYLRRFTPDVVGISLRNIDNQNRISPFYYYTHFQTTLATAKKSNPYGKIVLGGPGFSMFAERIMQRNPAIDYGIYQEGEESFPELLENLSDPSGVRGVYFRLEGKVVFTGYRPLPDFGNLPIPRRDFLEIDPYLNHMESLGIQTKRGCYLKCAYCNYPQLNGNQVRIREAKSVCDEMEYLIRQFAIKHFMFVDGVFNIPLKHAEEICEEMIRRELKLRWSAWLDIKHATKEFLSLAIRAGCVSTTFSPDGLSQNALDGLQKGLREKDVKDSFSVLIRDKNLRSLNVTYGMFVNPPGETFSGLLKTILFFLKSKLYLSGRGGTCLNWIRLEPGTKVLSDAIEKGLVPGDIDLLPEDIKGFKKLFYSKPPLKYFDFLLIAMLKSLALFKLLLFKFGIKK